TARKETYQKLKRAQDLLRHQIPDGSPAEIVDRALSVLLEDLERKRFAAVAQPRSGPGPKAGSRPIPARVRRSGWRPEGGRCGFVAKDGRRCGSEAFLQFHHLKPFAVGGEASLANIVLRCGPHNRHESRLFLDASDPRRLAIRPGTDGVSTPEARRRDSP